jgi:hypothetical protein
MKMKVLLTMSMLFACSAFLIALPRNMQNKKSTTLQNWDDLLPYKSYTYTTKSMVHFPLNNDGIIALNSGHLNSFNDSIKVQWPRNSENQYIFGGGLWFGAKKWNADTNKYSKLVSIGYNPNSGRSWFIPGSINDGDLLLSGTEKKYRIYRSSDFNETTGVPHITSDGPSWPLWKTDYGTPYHYGTTLHDYVNNVNNRNIDTYPDGPLFVSDEDFSIIMKDTDLSLYEMGAEVAQKRGYPLKSEIEQRVYSWETGEMKDVIVISYILENKSDDTLFDCFLAHVSDPDLGHISDTIHGSYGFSYQAGNDYARFYHEDPTLNMGYVWSGVDRGEEGNGLGYMGLSLIETPAVDENGYVRSDKVIFQPEEQIGVTSFPTWPISLDKLQCEDRYDFMASGIIGEQEKASDIRMMLSSGPFNIAPGDKAHFAIALTFAMPAKGGEADGTPEDITGLKANGKMSVGGKTQATSSSLIGKTYAVKEKYYSEVISSRVHDEIIKAEELNVYPNPSYDFIYLPQLLKNQEIYYIYNMKGSIVLEGGTNQKINISNLNSGAYLMYIGGKTYKFIKE